MSQSPVARHLVTDPPVRASGKGFAIGASLVAAAVAVMSATKALPADDLLATCAGAGVALLAVGGVAVLQRRLLRHTAAARSPGTQVQLALGVAFVAKLLCLALGVLALVVAGVKFSGVAAFAVSFAAASLVLQVCNAALSTRARANPLARAVPDPARTDPLP